jgi:hypothetical protein
LQIDDDPTLAHAAGPRAPWQSIGGAYDNLEEKRVITGQAGDPQKEINFIASQIEKGEIKSVEILIIPANFMTSHAISSDELLKLYHYKVTVPVRGSWPSLTSALRVTKVAKAGRKTDLRWGVLFTFVSGQTESIYLDGFGKLGQVDEVPVTFEDGGLYSWLQGLSVCLK